MADSRLAVIIELVDKFSAEFKNFSTQVKAHEKDLKKVGMAAAGMGAAVVGAMALSVKSYMNAGDEVQKMAVRTGWSTQALSELRHAANLSGTSMGTVETATKQIGRAHV